MFATQARVLLIDIEKAARTGHSVHSEAHADE
jgi:hypothetical protein